MAGHQPGGRMAMALFDPVKGFGVTFSTMFKKVVTEEYPEVKKITAPRFHGKHQLNRHPDGLEKCVGCELCAWACPADAIFVEGGDNTDEARYSPGERYGADYQINYLRCIGCGLCIEACPTRSLTMLNFYELADDNRQDLNYTKEMLIALAAAADTAATVSTGEAIAFWVLGPVALAGALGMIFSRNAVHSALWLVLTMLSLGIMYMVQQAPFLGFVQIIVYTGAIMML